jgi:hypothetical protein
MLSSSCISCRFVGSLSCTLYAVESSPRRSSHDRTTSCTSQHRSHRGSAASDATPSSHRPRTIGSCLLCPSSPRLRSRERAWRERCRGHPQALRPNRRHFVRTVHCRHRGRGLSIPCSHLGLSLRVLSRASREEADRRRRSRRRRTRIMFSGQSPCCGEVGAWK